MADCDRGAKRRKVEGDEAREDSPEPVEATTTSSPSPTRASPSPNRTPRAPPTEDMAQRSRPPSTSTRADISPIRAPYSVNYDSRSNAPERASIDLPPQIDSVEEA